MRGAAMYEVVGADERCVVIRDVGHIHRCLTITNDAQGIVRAVSHAEALGDRRLFYYDSDGRLDELLHVGPVFAGFAPDATNPEPPPLPDLPEPTYGYHPDEDSMTEPDRTSMTATQLRLAYRLAQDEWIANRLGLDVDPDEVALKLAEEAAAEQASTGSPVFAMAIRTLLKRACARTCAGVLLYIDGETELPDLADPTGATEGVLRQALREQPGMMNARTRYSRSKGGWVVNVDVTERTQPLSYPTEVEAIGHQLLERRAFVRLLPQPIPPGPVPGIPARDALLQLHAHHPVDPNRPACRPVLIEVGTAVAIGWASSPESVTCPKCQGLLANGQARILSAR